MACDRTIRITFYVTEEELSQAIEVAKDRGFSKPQLLRYLLKTSYKDLVERKKYEQESN